MLVVPFITQKSGGCPLFVVDDIYGVERLDFNTNSSCTQDSVWSAIEDGKYRWGE
jgi:hypothetical protein